MDLTAKIPLGANLVAALGQVAEEAGADAAIFTLDGVALAPFDYVMPASAVDDRHVAWYSDTYQAPADTLARGVAVLGRKDGDWFLHVHGDWGRGPNRRFGHLLPASLTVGAACVVSGTGIAGAGFKAQLDPETEFTLFRVTGGEDRGDAVIATIAPHADLTKAIRELAAPLGDVRVLGLGSLCGAAFDSGATMTCPVSEILLFEATVIDGQVHLPCIAVDLHGTHFEGTLMPGKAPVLVTAELLLAPLR